MQCAPLQCYHCYSKIQCTTTHLNVVRWRTTRVDNNAYTVIKKPRIPGFLPRRHKEVRLSACVRELICKSVLPAISWMNESTSVKLVTINHWQVHMTLMILRRSLVQRSRSVSDRHRNLVNAIAAEPLQTSGGRPVSTDLTTRLSVSVDPEW